MSKTKAIQVDDRLAWALDNSHDIVLAHMVEAAETIDRPAWLEPNLEHWRLWASIPDLAFEADPSWNPDQRVTVVQLIERALGSIRRRGQVSEADVRSWSVLAGQHVSGGFLRFDSLPADALIDTAEGLRDMLNGDLPEDPPGGWWCLGFPGGRSTIPRRPHS